MPIEFSNSEAIVTEYLENVRKAVNQMKDYYAKMDLRELCREFPATIQHSDLVILELRAEITTEIGDVYGRTRICSWKEYFRVIHKGQESDYIGNENIRYMLHLIEVRSTRPILKKKEQDG